MRTRYRNRGKYITFSAVFFCLLIVLILGIIFLPSKSYSVVFKVDDATNNVLTKNGKVERPTDPVKEGYTFIGWYLDGELFNFDRKLDNDAVLEARFKKIEDIESFMVYFSVDNIITNTKEIKKGERVGEVVSPDIQGKKFIGWYLNDSLYDFNNEVTSTITLIAKFENDSNNEELTITSINYSTTSKSVTIYPSINKDVNVTYKYLIDNGSYQDSNYFNDLTSGYHKVMVYAYIDDNNKLYKDINIFIDKINNPIINSSNTFITNKDVSLSVSNINNYDLYVKCGNTDYIKTNKDILLKENNTCIFKLSDGVNYSDEVSYKVSNIDKNSPIITSKLEVSNVTTKKVILTSRGVDDTTSKDKLTYKYTLNGITNNDGIFDNVKYSKAPLKALVEIYDEAGNKVVDEIDNVSLKAINTPVVNVSNNYKDNITKDDIVLEVLNKEDFNILVNGNINNTNIIHITKNGEYEIVLSDGVNSSVVPYYIKVSNLDKLAPDITINNVDITTKKIELDVTSIDNKNNDYINGSYVTTLYKIDDNEYQESCVFNNLIANKEYKITIKSIDEAGNTSKVIKTYKTLDMPIPDIILTTYEYTKEDISFKLLSSYDGNDSNMNLVYSFDNSCYTAINKKMLESIKYHDNLNKTYIFKYYDGINYSKELKITITNYDNESPTIINEGITKTTKKVIFNPKIIDKESIDNITFEYAIDGGDYTSNDTFDNLTTGIHSYKIKATDKALNSSILEGYLEIEKPINPEFDYNDDKQEITNKDIIIKLTNKNDNLILQKVLDTGYEDIYGDVVISSNKEEKYVFYDGINRSDEVSINVTKIDKTSPIVEATTISFTIKIIVNATSNEDVSYKYSLEDQNHFSDSNIISNLNMSTNYTIYIKAIDLAGNETIISINAKTTNVSSPVISKSTNDITNESVILTKEKDSFTTVYGLSEEDISINNIKNNNINIFNNLTISKNSKYYFRNYEIVDNKYLFSDVILVSVDNIDTTKPVISTINKEVTTKSISVEVLSTDNMSSNLSYNLRLMDGENEITNSLTNTLDANNLINNKTYKLIYSITDEASNVLEGEKDIKTKDLPKLELTINNSNKTKDDILLYLGNIDNSFNIYSYNNNNNVLNLVNNLELSNDGFYITITSNGTYSYKVSDGYNYSETYFVTINNIDKEAPQNINPVANLILNNLNISLIDDSLLEEDSLYKYILRKLDSSNNILEEKDYSINTTNINNLSNGKYKLYIYGEDEVGNSFISNNPYEFSL